MRMTIAGAAYGLRGSLLLGRLYHSSVLGSVLMSENAEGRERKGNNLK